MPEQKNNNKINSLDFALTLLIAGKYEESYQIIKIVLDADLNNPTAWHLMCRNLRKLKKFEASAACAKRAVELSPNNQIFLSELGHSFVLIGRKDDALETHIRALSCGLNDPGTLSTYAIALRSFGDCEKARIYFDKAFKFDPENIPLRWERATNYLQLGLLKEGWKDFELRKDLGIRTEPNCPMPQWRGEDLKGKKILLYEEQGFGDTILCARYIPLIAALGATVFVYCRKPLQRLFENIPGIERVVFAGEALEITDFYCPVMSLPGIFKTDLDSIPNPTTFNIPSSPPKAVMEKLNLAGNQFKVGIVWSGNDTFVNNYKRAVNIERFLSLTAIPNVQLYSLQKGPKEKDISDVGADNLIIDLGSHLNDFADTAATLKNLDLVIMTDSSVAHLAGSIGCPIWNLLDMSPYWLYLTNREDSPWYSSMCLIRQRNPGDWDDVFERVVTKLKEAAYLKLVGK